MDTIDPKVHEEMHKRYTQRLAEAMVVPPYLESLAQQILNQQKDYEIEVDFD